MKENDGIQYKAEDADTQNREEPFALSVRDTLYWLAAWCGGF